MERESFENEEIGKLMNDNFVNIKVDREERPDVDSVYMTFVQVIVYRLGDPWNSDKNCTHNSARGGGSRGL